MSFTVELPSQVEGCRLPGLRRELFHRLQQQSDLILDCSNVTQLSRGGQALLVATLRAAAASDSPSSIPATPWLPHCAPPDCATC